MSPRARPPRRQLRSVGFQVSASVIMEDTNLGESYKAAVLIQDVETGVVDYWIHYHTHVAEDDAMDMAQRMVSGLMSQIIPRISANGFKKREVKS